MSKSHWMKEQKGNFSNDGKDTFDPEKRYVGVRLQQGVPLLDRDWNELEDIRRYEEAMLRRWYIGNGSPDDGFKISAVKPAANDFKISAGRCLVDGFEAVNEKKDLPYSEQEGVAKLTKPTAGREDLVYLDLWIGEITSREDDDLKNSDDVNVETCVRHNLEWRVRVAEGNKEYAREEFHHYYDIARIKRKSEKDAIPNASIQDMRRIGLALHLLKDTFGSLTDNSIVDALHRHSKLVASDGSPDPALSVDKVGNVGIGTTKPAGRLEIMRSWGDWAFLRQDRKTEGGGGFHIHNPWKDTDTADRNRLEIAYRTSEGTNRWGQFVIHGPTGNVGIGTSEPKNKLQLVGDLAIGANNHRAGKIRLWQESDNKEEYVSHAIGTEAYYNVYGAGKQYANSIGHKFYRGGGELIAQIGVGGSGKPATRLNSYFAGSVGIGTADPKAKLEVQGGAIMPSAGNSVQSGIMFPKDPGGGRGDAAWIRYYPRSGENTTLEIGTSNDKGDHIALMASGNVGIGTADPKAPLHVANYMAVGPFSATGGQGGIDVTGKVAELGFVKRTLTSWPSAPVAGDRFVWYNPDGTARLWTHERGDLLTVKNTGEVSIPKGAILNGVAIGVDPPGNVNFNWAYETLGTTDKRWNLRLHSFNSIYFHVNNQKAASKGVAKDGNWTGSTREIKNNICDFTAQEAIEILADLNPIKFSYRSDEKNKLHAGFIAEEVPDIIASPDKKMISEIDIVAVLTKVVQKQQEKIADLSKKIELLECH